MKFFSEERPVSTTRASHKKYVKCLKLYLGMWPNSKSPLLWIWSHYKVQLRHWTNCPQSLTESPKSVHFRSLLGAILLSCPYTSSTFAHFTSLMIFRKFKRKRMRRNTVRWENRVVAYLNTKFPCSKYFLVLKIDLHLLQFKNFHRLEFGKVHWLLFSFSGPTRTSRRSQRCCIIPCARIQRMS